VVKCAEKYSDFVIGFISQSRLTTSNRYLHCTPGVHLNNTGDQLGQQYVTPRQAIDGRGADILIVGRGIIDSINRVKTAEEYQLEGYQVYEQFRKISE
jgi:orotidine-5'-phosphate decarboxylase